MSIKRFEKTRLQSLYNTMVKYLGDIGGAHGDFVCDYQFKKSYANNLKKRINMYLEARDYYFQYKDYILLKINNPKLAESIYLF